MSPDVPALAAMSTGFAALQLQPPADAPLSPTQQRYNALLACLAALSAQVERLQAWSDRHRHAHVQALYQAAQQTRALRQDLLLFLHAQMQGDALTAQQQRMARTQLRALMAQLEPITDPQVQAVVARYCSDEDAQERAQEQAELAQHPDAGCVFAMRVEVPGLPVNGFRRVEIET